MLTPSNAFDSTSRAHAASASTTLHSLCIVLPALLRDYLFCLLLRILPLLRTSGCTRTCCRKPKAFVSLAVGGAKVCPCFPIARLGPHHQSKCRQCLRYTIVVSIMLPPRMTGSAADSFPQAAASLLPGRLPGQGFLVLSPAISEWIWIQ